MDIKSSEKFFSYLVNLHNKYSELTAQLSDPDITNDRKKFASLSKELSNLSPLEENYQKYVNLKNQLEESEDILDSSDDIELQNLAEEDIANLKAGMSALENDIKLMMVSDVTENSRNVFLEIRAGAGGNEASLFASDLLRMYSRISERKGWKHEIISTNYSGIGGIKEITMYIKGSNVNKFLKYESGVHRVQRVPQTESSGRIHTSTVTVAVLPEVDDVEVEINPKDIRIDTYRASGAGGQHVNKTESAIRITHIPSGLIVTCQDEKSQHKNRSAAMKVLRSRLLGLEQERLARERAKERKSLVSTGDRSAKIRTYNFPQGRITDHRINYTSYRLEQVLDGDLLDFIDQLRLADQQSQMMAE
ncbi:MAG: peptide chain release factor 1 [Candidatus Heimdallarchaeota archaeon]|nr:peptide chain release factor 1 [Candidatus Heimdallarchaeota archaeon]